MYNQSKLIRQLSELYLIQRGHYLIQYKEPIGYRQYTAGQIINGKKIKPLMDWQFEKHLQGNFTVGTFGGKVMTKFLTFDVDFHDPQMAKWIVYKILETLKEIGIKDYYVSYSGNKGYHIDLFFEDLIQMTHAKKFFDYVIYISECLPYFDSANKVEFRVSDTQGIKLPLGYHQKSGNYCGFCLVENELSVMSKEDSETFIFTINKMNSEIILDIIGFNNKESYDKDNYVKTEDAISPHKELPIYNPTEDYSIDRTIDLLMNGLKVQGSRHNVTIDIAKYFRYMGMDEIQCKNELCRWMDDQDKNTYTTPLEQCYEDINSLVKWVYENECSIKPKEKKISITLEEIKWIIQNCPEKNQKLITYAMLIHSKRFATMQGVFFMTFNQLFKATGLYDQAAQSQVNKLIKLGTIEVIERNRKQKGNVRNKPNKYRLNKPLNEESEEVENVFITEDMNNFHLCLKFYFQDIELKEMLTRRQYKSLIG